MAPNTNSKTSALFAELMTFVATSADVAFNDLGKHARDAGWVWHLRQVKCETTPFQSFAVTFLLFIGKGPDAQLEPLDELTIHVPAWPNNLPMVAPSLYARLSAEPTVISAVFGRVPPQILENAARAEARAAAAAAQAPAGPVNGTGQAAELDVDMSRGDADLTRSQAVDVVKGLARDGMPIFVDLFALDPSIAKEAVIDSVLDELARYLNSPDVTTPEAVTKVYIENPVIGEFFKDLGTEADRKELIGLLDGRKKDLMPVTDEPRRRRGAAVN